MNHPMYLNEAAELYSHIKALSESLAQAGVELNTRLADYQDADAEFRQAKADFELWATTDATDPLKNGTLNLFAGKNDDDRDHKKQVAYATFGNDPRWNVNEHQTTLAENEYAWRRAQRVFDSLCKDLEAFKLQANVLSILLAHSNAPLPIAA